MTNKPETEIDASEWLKRGPEYLRGYASAMRYAAAFVRDAGEQNRTFKSALNVLAGHLDEKVDMERRSAAADERLAASIANMAALCPTKQEEEGR